MVRPLRIVATHLASLDRVIFSSGEVAQAVHASSAIPGACVPVNIDGELYIDGGIADPTLQPGTGSFDVLGALQ